MDKFLAKYTENGIEKAIIFNLTETSKEQAETWLKNHNIQNFVLITEPKKPEPIGENYLLFSGEVGFDITVDNITDALNQSKGIILDSWGGNFYESLKIYDKIKLTGTNPSIGVMGACASATMQILLSTKNRWATPNSVGAIHNPWAEAQGDNIALSNTAENLLKEKNKLANLYSKETGLDVNVISDMMDKTTIMTAQEMLNYGFIKEIKTNLNNSSVEQKNDDMTKTEELAEKVNKMESAWNKFLNFFGDEKPKVNNIILTEATGKEIEFPELEDESQIAVGVTANIDGAPANGEFVMAGGMHDGKTLVFEAGKLTEIKEPAPETNEEMEALVAENKLLKEQIEAQNAFRKNAEKQINEMTAQIAEFKNLVKTSGFENDVPDLKDKNKQPESFVFKGKKQTKS